jgi:hypothetical protein
MSSEQKMPHASDDPPVSDAEAFVNVMMDLFDAKCEERLMVGAKDYGATAFVTNDVMNMLFEELYDVTNYARMMFVKLMAATLNAEDLMGLDLTNMDLQAAVTNWKNIVENKPPLGPSTFMSSGGVE